MDLAISGSFRELLEASHSLYQSTSNPPPGEGRRSNVVESVRFSRKFIISYNGVLLFTLLCCTILHWCQKLVRARKSERLLNDDARSGKGGISQAREITGASGSSASSSSSSSSTLGHSVTPPERAKERGQIDETTSLLRPSSTRSSRAPINILRSFLMYQPSNIPIVNKTLPSNATSLAIILFFALNLFYLLFRVTSGIPVAFILADRAGLVFVANLPLLYLFAAKNQPVKWMTGHSYESLNIVHRRLGEWMCFLALIHFAGMLVTWYTLLSAALSIWRFLATPLVWLGLVCFVAYQTLYLTSLGSFRQRFYELFLAVHIVLQVVALGFLFFHHPGSRPYVGIALAIFLIDRLVFRLWLKTRTVKADLSIMDDGETVLLSSDWPISYQPSWRKLHIKHGWEPTEHVFLTVPALATKHIIQAHPFTIASAAPTLEKDRSKNRNTHAWLSFIIRARDGFSRDLLRYAQSHPSAIVRVDGPYGSLHALEMLRARDHAIIIAGGSGIAVAYPLLWDLLVNHPRSASGKKKVTLIWVVHDEAHIEWIGNDRLSELRERGLQVLVPPPTRKAGRPDVEGLMQMVVADNSTGGTVGVVVSGPDGMNRCARNTCAKLVRQGMDVSVFVEKFGW